MRLHPGYVLTPKESLHWKLTVGEKFLAVPGIEPASAAWRSDGLTNWATFHPLVRYNFGVFSPVNHQGWHQGWQIAVASFSERAAITNWYRLNLHNIRERLRESSPNCDTHELLLIFYKAYIWFLLFFFFPLLVDALSVVGNSFISYNTDSETGGIGYTVYQSLSCRLKFMWNLSTAPLATHKVKRSSDISQHIVISMK